MFLFTKLSKIHLNYHNLRIKSQFSADPRPADPQGNMNEALFSLKNLEVLSSRAVNNDFI